MRTIYTEAHRQQDGGHELLELSVALPDKPAAAHVAVRPVR